MISTGNDELSVARSVSVLIVAVLIYMTYQTLRPVLVKRIHTSSDCNTFQFILRTFAIPLAIFARFALLVDLGAVFESSSCQGMSMKMRRTM